MKLSKEEENILQGNVVFDGYPGKEKNRYYTKNGDWYRELADGDGSFNKITNKGSINALNNYFLEGTLREANLKLQQESTVESNLSGGKIYTGLPDKEDNKYKTENGLWYRQTLGSKKWVEVKGDGAIDYLNRYFLTDKEKTKKEEKRIHHENWNIEVKKEEKLKKERSDFLKPITEELIRKTEEDAVKIINATYNKSGIYAEE